MRDGPRIFLKSYSRSKTRSVRDAGDRRNAQTNSHVKVGRGICQPQEAKSPMCILIASATTEKYLQCRVLKTLQNCTSNLLAGKKRETEELGTGSEQRTYNKVTDLSTSKSVVPFKVNDLNAPTRR